MQQRVALLLALVACAFASASAHGYLASPMARNVVAWKANEYYCAQCGAYLRAAAATRVGL